jgi:cytochrome c2
MDFLGWWPSVTATAVLRTVDSPFPEALARSARLLALCAFAQLNASCNPATPAGVDGAVERGQRLVTEYGCTACHVIPGAARPQGNVGPPLSAIASRVYLAGILPNTPGNLVLWIRAPNSVDPSTGMPSLGVSAAHARDIAAFLYTLD